MPPRTVVFDTDSPPLYQSPENENTRVHCLSLLQNFTNKFDIKTVKQKTINHSGNQSILIEMVSYESTLQVSVATCSGYNKKSLSRMNETSNPSVCKNCTSEVIIQKHNVQLILTWYLNEPCEVCIYNVFSTLPVWRARKTTSKVVFPPGGTICKRNKIQINKSQKALSHFIIS